MNYLLQSVKSSISLHTTIKQTSSICLRQSSAFEASSTNVQLKSSRVSPMKTFIRSLGHFFIHPERMKQLMKAKDAHAVCNYIASEKYKKKLQDMVERQKKKVFDAFSEGVSSKEIRFQHIINCAQPNPVVKKKSNDVEHDDEEEEEVRLPVIPKKRRKILKTTIMSVMLKKKRQEEKDIYWKQPNTDSSETSKKKKLPKRKSNINKRSTILPIMLRKLQERAMIGKLENNARTTYNQEQSETERTREDLCEEDTFVDTSHSKSNFKGQKEGVRNLTTSAVQKDTFSERVELKRNQEFENYGTGLNSPKTDSKILPEKSEDMHELFTRDPEKSRKSKKQSSTAPAKNAKKTSKSVHSRIKNKYLRRRPRIKIRKQVFLSPNSEVNLPVNGCFHVDENLCNVIETSHLSQESNPTYDEGSLYNRVKKENQTKPLISNSEKYACRDPTPVWGHFRSEPSLTYRLNNVRKYAFDPYIISASQETPTSLFHFIPRHLIQLPQLTPEGYRVMLYSVRDPDPTKLNFSDAVKVFCMYNDCVLSEDGLKEGYVVIFDMKDVQLGHLARVSLPALRCFMLYIQEAHPVRLKAIHVLNTASWIHHVMRLIIPLVKSEILNLVKFHRGNTPEDFSTQLLPQEYGGNAGTLDELDQHTHALLKKYEAWMLETSRLMSDESKRPKKASWWGLWSGSSKATTNVELDEKTILKNLQID